MDYKSGFWAAVAVLVIIGVRDIVRNYPSAKNKKFFLGITFGMWFCIGMWLYAGLLS